MGLVVSAQVLRELIADGEYLVECIEQRDRGKIAVAFAMRSRAQPYSIQIETMDNKLGGLFRALTDEKPSRGENHALMKIGSQSVPIVKVHSIPADESQGRRRGRRRTTDADGSQARGAAKPAVRRRRSARPLVLMPQDAPNDSAAMPTPSRRRRTTRASDRHETR
jgi:hypothetical protein